MKLYGVIYSADDGAESQVSAWLTEDDAAAAGARLAREKWAGFVPGEPFPEGADDWEAMDVLRGLGTVRLEVETVEVGDDVIRAAFARL